MTAQPTSGPGAEDREPERTVIRDRRRIDPDTGELRDTPDEVVVDGPAGEPGPAAEGPSAAGAANPTAGKPGTNPGTNPGEGSGAAAAPANDAAAAAEALAASRLEDLKRVQAEYVNFRHRVERDADQARLRGMATVFEALLPVLDDVTLARQHGDLDEGPLAKIAEKLVAALEKQGLTSFGEPGEAFDPTRHEALMQQPSADVDTETVSQVLQPGYTVGDRVLRAARVAVSVPEG